MRGPISTVYSNVTLLGAILIAVSLAAASHAWQITVEGPFAPQRTDDVMGPNVDLTAELVEVGPASDDGEGPSVLLPPQLPPPRVQPAEDFMSPEIPPAGSSRRGQRATPAAAVEIGGAAHSESSTSLKASVFKGAEPGVTTVDQLQAIWGEPIAETTSPRGKVLTFKVTPFPRVDATFAEATLHSLVVSLKKPIPPQQIQDILKLNELQPVEIVDADEVVLGRAFPERGLTLSYAKGRSKQVAYIVMEPVTAESFLLRAKNDHLHRWQQSLDDLEKALTLAPQDARIWWLKAEILAQQSEFREAALAIEQSLLIEPESAVYQLTAARLIAEAGHYDDATIATQAVLDQPSQKPLLAAQANLMMGDLLRDGPQHDCAAALDYHQKAIDTALPLATSDRHDVRRASKRLLIDAHLAVAHDIAQGRWKEKPTVVPKWLDRAQALVNEVVANEGADPSLSFDVACQRLDAYAWLEGKVDPTAAVAKARELAEEILPQAVDATYRRQISWQLAKALVDAVDIERSRNNTKQALTYGKSAEEIFNKIGDEAWNSGRTQFQVSRLSFLMGSILAVQVKDHAAAIVWFEKSLDDIARPEPDGNLVQTADRGEWMVSMGVSYWALGDKRKAVRLTELGAGLIEAAHREQVVAAAKLAVPYNNLAFMHKELGETDKAQEFADLASRLEATDKR